MHARTIMNVIGIDHGDEDMFAAAAVAQKDGCHLIAAVIANAPPPPSLYMGGHVPSDYGYDWESEYDRVAARAAELEMALSARGFQGDVHPLYSLLGLISEEIAKRAAYVDIVVIGRRMQEDIGLARCVLDGVLFASPVPVLLLGKDNVASLRPETVLLAWNSTLEAGAALRSSLDVLVHAKDARVVLVDPLARTHAVGEEPGADIAAFLARHGATVTVDVLASGARDPAFILQQHAGDTGAGLIVMGAYGHSRLRERVLGGTTDTMVRHPGVPVLMAR